MTTLPLIFYPTTLLWVDDDELFLQAVTEGFKDSYQIKTYRSPQEALQFLRNYKSVLPHVPFLKGRSEHEDYDLSDHLPVDINLDTVCKLLNNPQRQADIAVMIVDYHMEGMTGIALCRELQHLPIKKILLTGAANQTQAVDAFNEGIIDRFLRKDDTLLPENLSKYLALLTTDFFRELTKPLLAHLEADYRLPQSDPTFVEFFQEWCETHEIAEYYLADKNGSYLTVDQQGQQRYFVIHTDRTLNTFAELHGSEVEAQPFVQAIKTRAQIPYFGWGKEAWNYETKTWQNYFYAAQVLAGRENYYWACVEGS